jgi:hypothetical protein
LQIDDLLDLRFRASSQLPKSLRLVLRVHDTLGPQFCRLSYSRPIGNLGNLWATSHRRAPKAAICFV